MVLSRVGGGWRQMLCVLGLLGVPALASADEWMITLVDGDAVVVDGTRRLAAAPGLRLAPGAIVETNAKTALLRLEGAEMSTFDLGADTRAMLVPPGFAPRGERAPQLYLMQGWVKATSRGNAEVGGIVAPALEVLPFRGAFVLQALRREQFLFVESGRADLIERRAGNAALTVNTGEFYGGESGRRGSVSPRPAPGWLQKVPRAYRDPIPLRAAALRDRRVEGQLLPGPTYAQLADWLAGEPLLRRELPTRFAALARDAGFRSEVQARLDVHPEWAPILTAQNQKPQAAMERTR